MLGSQSGTCNMELLHFPLSQYASYQSAMLMLCGGSSEILDVGYIVFDSRIIWGKKSWSRIQQLVYYVRTTNCIIIGSNNIVSLEVNEHLQYINCAQLSNAELEQAKILDLNFLLGHLLIDAKDDVWIT